MLPDGGETYVFWEGYWGGFAVRPPGSSTYVRKHLFSKEVAVGIQAAENPRGQVLVVLRAWRHSGSRLIAAEISPRGALEATHVLETGPSEPESGYDYEGAIGPSGQELVISTDAAHRVWAHAAASRAPAPSAAQPSRICVGRSTSPRSAFRNVAPTAPSTTR